jgi:hypothetical protein
MDQFWIINVYEVGQVGGERRGVEEEDMESKNNAVPLPLRVTYQVLVRKGVSWNVKGQELKGFEKGQEIEGFLSGKKCFQFWKRNFESGNIFFFSFTTKILNFQINQVD